MVPLGPRIFRGLLGVKLIFFVLLFQALGFPKTKPVRGYVIEENSSPLEKVKVVSLPSKISAETNEEGLFVIEIPVRDRKLILSKAGYHIILIGHQNHPEVIGTMGQLPDGSIDPVRDAEIINLELIFADIETISKRILKTEKLLKTSDQEIKKNYELLMTIKSKLESGNFISLIECIPLSQINGYL